MTDELKSGRGRWWLASGAALAVVLGAGTWVTVTVVGSSDCVDTGQPRSYHVKELRKSFEPQAVSPDGRYAVGQRNGKSRDALVLWHDGEYTEVDIPDGVPAELLPTDVNNSGVVVGGFLEPGYTQSRPWRYQDGEFQELDDPDGEPELGSVYAVSDDGTAVGRAAAGDAEEPVLWPASKARATRLPLPEFDPDTDQTSIDISDAGVVVSAIGGKLRVWDGGGKARVLGDVTDETRPMISDDWVLADGKRWNLAEDREYPMLNSEALFNAVDSCGRGYGRSGEPRGRPILDDGKVRLLPELHWGDEPENPYGRVEAASADGSVLVGQFMGRAVMWTYR